MSNRRASPPASRIVRIATIDKNLDLEFCEATLDDLESLVELLADDPLGATREDESKPLNPGYLKAFDSIERDPNNERVVVKIDGQSAGMLQLTFVPYLTHTGSWRCQREGVRIARPFAIRG